MDADRRYAAKLDEEPRWNQIARQMAHRPWFPPPGPWIAAQSWRDLVFAHWPVSPSLIRSHLPPGLELETFSGAAWVSVVPFRISYIAPRAAPRRLHLSFPELNVRTYVATEGKPGVWFFSLDAASLTAVIGARVAFHLPYYWANMQMQSQADGWISYFSQRRHPGVPVEFVARYRPTGPPFRGTPGSLEAWLTERYCLYAADRHGWLYRTEIQHVPWPLQPAEAEITINTMAPQEILLSGSPLLHFARALDVVAWAPRRLPR